jgi:hypothetical protein
LYDASYLNKKSDIASILIFRIFFRENRSNYVINIIMTWKVAAFFLCSYLRIHSFLSDLSSLRNCICSSDLQARGIALLVMDLAWTRTFDGNKFFDKWSKVYRERKVTKAGRLGTPRYLKRLIFNVEVDVARKRSQSAQILTDSNRMFHVSRNRERVYWIYPADSHVLHWKHNRSDRFLIPA